MSEQTPQPVTFSSFGASLDAVSEMKNVAEVFVIGGQSLYQEALSDEMSHLCKLVIGTRINKDFESDCFMPAFEDRFEPLFVS